MRPTRGALKHRLWDRLVEEHHYLRFHGIIGKGLRHDALHGGIWIALVCGAAVSAPAPDRQQFAVRHSGPEADVEPSVPRTRPKPSAAVRLH